MSRADEIKRLAGLARSVVADQGVGPMLKLSVAYAQRRAFSSVPTHAVRDILFINGTTLPHPERFRVDHQMEQLQAHGLTVDKVYFEELQLRAVSRYRGFIFFRCPATRLIEQFIAAAKSANRTVFFDVDDLVIDTKYTDAVPYVAAMATQEKALYDAGVRRMRQTMLLCDHAITTTEELADVIRNDIPDVLINRNVASEQMVQLSRRATAEVKPSGIVIGYFSGSVTHNDDFAMVVPALVEVMRRRSDVRLLIAGLLDKDPRLTSLGDRVEYVGFSDWKRLPRQMAACSVVIAPLVDSQFNRAKSENKWLEAALVGVPVVASDVGAFRQAITTGVDGVLVQSDGWLKALNELIDDPTKRQEIGRRALEVAQEKYTAIPTGGVLAAWVNQRLAPHVGFLIPSSDISGGINVVLKHADILRSQGYCVTILNDVSRALTRSSRHLDRHRYDEIELWNSRITCRFDMMVATLWSTVGKVMKYPRADRRAYFVQSYEVDFMPPGDLRRLGASSTYSEPRLEYLTMSPWCQTWLRETYGQVAKLAGNGLDLDNYPQRRRAFTPGTRTKILVEGDSKDPVKNVDEAFRIVELLDPQRFEVGYLSYRSGPKKWYRVDQFHHHVAPDQVGLVYAAYDVLLKTSKMESFSYPPLEMMATGGLVVVRPNEGNQVYLRDGVNGLSYEPDNLGSAVSAIRRLVEDPGLRATLTAGGLATASEYSWQARASDVARLYE